MKRGGWVRLELDEMGDEVRAFRRWGEGVSQGLSICRVKMLFLK